MFLFDRSLSQKVRCEFMRIEKEFGAHTWGICSTHEYYETVEFQLQTPTGSDRKISPKICDKKMLIFKQSSF